MEARLAAILADTEELVKCESPSADLEAVARSADIVADVGARRLGSVAERIVIDGRTHLRWRLRDGPARVLLLCHHDTVWPLGSLETHPYTVSDGVMRGPGCVDMKAGIVLGLHALAQLGVPGGGALLVTGDEEIGSPSSRALIETEAAGCSAALVLESAANDGALKTERKGVSLYQVRAVGRAAHAGLEPELGVNATVELAHQVLAVARFADPERGTSVTPTALSSGTTSNTVPAVGSFAVDVRMWDSAEQARVDAAMRALLPVVPDSVLQGSGGRHPAPPSAPRVAGGPTRAPLSAAASAELFGRAGRLAALLGLAPLTAAAVGGASDGNFTAGGGTPTLDGLGAAGGGAHADDEHVRVAELPGRAALIAALISDLLDGAPAGSPGGTG